VKIKPDLSYRPLNMGNVIGWLMNELRPVVRACRKELNLLNSTPLVVTASMTVKPFEHYALVVDDTNGDVDITLPDPDDVLGMPLWVRKTAGSNTTTLVGDINGGSDLVIAVNTGVIMKAAAGYWWVFTA
jgi:hypothetical protein